jgi:hypothetical protein
VDLGFDRAHLGARELGDLPELEVLEAEEDQDLPLRGREPVEGPADELGLLAGFVDGVGPRLPARRLGELLVEREGRLLLPQMVDVGVAGDLEEPDVEPDISRRGRLASRPGRPGPVP